jgi:hypothetical protein
MLNRVITIFVAIALTLCIYGSAFAVFQDLELIRVYYDRSGDEIATDLGNVNSLVASGGTLPGSFGKITTGFAVYFALDRATNQLWASNSTTTAPQVIGQSTGLTAISNGTLSTYAIFNTQGGTTYTGLSSALNSYKNKLSSTQGWLGNTITGTTSRAATELNLTTLSTNNTQVLYHWANAKAATADIAGRTGVAVATITTNADGSTTISPPPSSSTIPNAPTIGTATAAGDGLASVTFTPPASNGGSPITLYTVTSTPDGRTGSGPASPIDVTGLVNGKHYTFTVTATNAVGSSAPSEASNSITTTGASTLTPQTIGTIAFTPATLAVGGATVASASATSGLAVTFSSTTPGVCTVNGANVSGITAGTCTVAADQAGDATYSAAPQITADIIVSAAGNTDQVPGSPTGVVATAGNGRATIEFTPPAANGGSSITGYIVTSTPGGIKGSSSAIPITVTGLTNGTPYTFTVVAINAMGTGTASAPSNIITPVVPPITFTITPAAATNGAISPAGSQTVVAGDTADFVIAPKSGFQISTVAGCGGTLSGTTYTTAGAVSNCTVTATFIAIPTLKGDLNDDKKVDITDALWALQFAIGLRTSNATDKARGDVAPLAGGKSVPDGVIDISDAVAILQKSVGLVSW